MRMHVSVGWATGLITCAIFAVYAGSLGNEFLHIDDGNLVTHNPIVTESSLVSVVRAFTSYDPELYIPLTLLTYQIEYALVGAHPFLFHFTSLLLHILGTLCVFAILRFLFRSTALALFGALFFGLHPLGAETVLWVSARKDVLSSALALASVALYCHFLERSFTRSFWLSVLLFFVALLAKVGVITLPILLLLIDAYRGRFSLRSVLEKWPYFALSLVFGIIALLGKASEVGGLSPLSHLLLSLKAAAFFMRMFVWPSPLALLYHQGERIDMFAPAFAGSALIIALIVIGTLWSLRYTRIALLGVGWYVIALIPNFGAFVKHGYVFFASDRYAYFPMIGLVILAVAALRFALGKSLAWKRVASALSGGILVACTVLTCMRTFDFRDSESLYLANVRGYPDSYAYLVTLGAYYLDIGRAQDAVAPLERAIVVRPDRFEAYANLGNAYGKLGRYDEGVQMLLAALQKNPQGIESLPAEIRALLE